MNTTNPYFKDGIVLLSMEESFELLKKLMDDGLTRWQDLKTCGVRHQTIRDHRRIELHKRMQKDIQIRGVTLQECIMYMKNEGNEEREGVQNHSPI